MSQGQYIIIKDYASKNELISQLTKEQNCFYLTTVNESFYKISCLYLNVLSIIPPMYKVTFYFILNICEYFLPKVFCALFI